MPTLTSSSWKCWCRDVVAPFEGIDAPMKDNSRVAALRTSLCSTFWPNSARKRWCLHIFLSCGILVYCWRSLFFWLQQSSSSHSLPRSSAYSPVLRPSSIVSLRSSVRLSRWRWWNAGLFKKTIMVTSDLIVTSLVLGPTFSVSLFVLMFKSIKNKLRFVD